MKINVLFGKNPLLVNFSNNNISYIWITTGFVIKFNILKGYVPYYRIHRYII